MKNQALWKKAADACEVNDIGELRRLVDGMNDKRFFNKVNKISSDGKYASLLHIAAKHSSVEIVEFLHRKGCDIFGKDDLDSLPVRHAADSFVDALAKVKYFTDIDNSLANVVDSVGLRPIHVAAHVGNADCVKYLLALPQNNIKTTALQALALAVGYGNAECVSALVECKDCDINEDFNVDAQERATSLVVACRNGYSKCVEALLASPDCDVNKRNPIIVAAMHSQADCVRLLASNPNCDVNVEVEQRGFWGTGWGTALGTALHYACGNGDAVSVRHLLANPRCDPNVISGFLYQANIHIQQCLDRCTPLHVAVLKGYTECIEALLSHPKCDVNIEAVGEGTALNMAVNRNREECVEILTAFHKCDVNIHNGKGQTVLHRSLVINRMDYAEMIMKNPTFQPTAGDIRKHPVIREFLAKAASRQTGHHLVSKRPRCRKQVFIR